ncbi:hypothetical protein Vadar_032213 [Vaccinium darrowii]|uniref:Uncharacterized protein n=1 Tax=Vaccinium darrowii TaxID=229202 RepID=A0ACB7YQY9_9ERIC|nr:hypothetical protein Vadar_032213 [Vaccinium darrowii]
MDTSEDHHTQIAKRKRTKRQRPQSPISDKFFDTGATEEEEEIANCLILLARGTSTNLPLSDMGHYGDEMGMKFTSKRISDEGNYAVYQCKTCDRRFTSFQALGGHRASHNKSINKQLSSDEEEKEEQFKTPVSSSPASIIPLQLSNVNSKKIHECWICGTEFGSGQALGGHMRRHRTTTENCCESKREKSGSLSFDLDLNFPAPESDETKFGSGAMEKQEQRKRRRKQQSVLVLSTAPTLVDCHY